MIFGEKNTPCSQPETRRSETPNFYSSFTNIPSGLNSASMRLPLSLNSASKTSRPSDFSTSHSETWAPGYFVSKAETTTLGTSVLSMSNSLAQEVSSKERGRSAKNFFFMGFLAQSCDENLKSF